MGITTDILADWDAALAALAWQFDMGVGETLTDAPINAYELPERADWQNAAIAPIVVPVTGQQVATAPLAPPSFAPVQSAKAAIAAAQSAADRCQNLDDLRAALAQFDHLDIKKGARDMVFGAGDSAADVLVLSDPPQREDERAKSPYSGDAAQLLEKMFAAIGLSQSNPDPRKALYLMPALPWRAPQDRAPTPDELAIIRPFVARHVALIAPKVVILMGNAALQLGMNTTGILRARGVWGQAFGLRALAMLTPQHLLQNPAAKREAWADLLTLKAALL